ncbi:MAG: hypothetical protein QM784_06290 [Polyangiaceae bacterium]
MTCLVVLSSLCGCKNHDSRKKHERAHHANAQVRLDTPAVKSAAPIQSRPQMRCPSISAGVSVGRVADRALDEASGLIVSRKNAGILWSHNDSGGGPKLFAMTEKGQSLGTYHLSSAKLEDWEDIAIAPDGTPNGWHLYVADIGTNAKVRHRITIYRVNEPDIESYQVSGKHKLKDVQRFDFEYPGHVAYDAETLLVDPRTLELFIVTKTRSEPPKVFRARPPLDPTHTTILDEVAELSIFDRGTKRSTLVTAGDISADGSLILIRTYTTAYLWRRDQTDSVAAALRREPCPALLAKEPQGETIAFSADGRAYFTLSEGHYPALYRFALDP